MVFLAVFAKEKMMAPEKKGLAPELFLVLSTPVRDISRRKVGEGC
jgi:hypothetical protein